MSAMTSIISAIIAGAVTLIGVLIANGKSQAVSLILIHFLARNQMHTKSRKSGTV